MSQVNYIAELDATGAVEHVWVKDAGARFAVPFDPARHSFRPDQPAEFHGVHRAAIEAWITASCRL